MDKEEAKLACATHAKENIEFSKKLVIFFGILDIIVCLYCMILVVITLDTTVLCYLIPAIAAEVASATAFYYNKAKIENRIKLMKAYDIVPTNEDFKDY